MTTSPPVPQKPSFGERLSLAFVAFARALMRLLLLLIIGLLIGGFAYSAYPWLEAQVITPLRENSRRLDDLATREATRSAASTQNAAAWQKQIATLEAARTADANALATLQAQLEAIQVAVQTQQESDQTALSATMGRLEALEADLAAWEAATRQITPTLQANTAWLQNISATLQAPDVVSETLRSEIQLLKAMQLLIRSQILLGQSNLGLAAQDIQAARQIILAQRAIAPPSQWTTLDAILVRLELALQNLPAAPALAADDLEMAWQLLLQGSPPGVSLTPAPPGLAETSPTPSTTPSASPAATSLPAQSPTATATSTPASYPTP